MEHVSEIAYSGTTVGALFGAAILRKPLEEARLTVVLATAYCEVGITVRLGADLTDEACWYLFYEVVIVATNVVSLGSLTSG